MILRVRIQHVRQGCFSEAEPHVFTYDAAIHTCCSYHTACHDRCRVLAVVQTMGMCDVGGAPAPVGINQICHSIASHSGPVVHVCVATSYWSRVSGLQHAPACRILARCSTSSHPGAMLHGGSAGLHGNQHAIRLLWAVLPEGLGHLLQYVCHAWDMRALSAVLRVFRRGTRWWRTQVFEAPGWDSLRVLVAVARSCAWHASPAQLEIHWAAPRYASLYRGPRL